MNYLRNKRNPRGSKFNVIIVILVLALGIYFHVSIFKVFSKATHFVFSPILSLGKSVGEGLDVVGSPFSSKRALIKENENLRTQIGLQEARMSNYNSILAENESLKSTLSRIGEPGGIILGAILSKPNHSPYDTLLIDIGEKHGVSAGNIIFAQGDVPIGRIEEVYLSSSKAVLFSSPGVETEVLLSSNNMFMKIMGRGGGNFEMDIPRDLILEKGEEVVLSGISPHTFALVESTISDPRDSFSKALLVSPVNVQNIKFVEVKK